MVPRFFDPARPDHSTTLGRLPGSPRIAEDGSVRPGGSGAPWLALLMPVLTIAGHGLYFVLRYLL